MQAENKTRNNIESVEFSFTQKEKINTNKINVK